MRTGTVKWYYADKEFGHLTCDDDGEDVFVHRRDVRGSDVHLETGERVRFVVRMGPRGPHAVEVERVGAPG